MRLIESANFVKQLPSGKMKRDEEDRLVRKAVEIEDEEDRQRAANYFKARQKNKKKKAPKPVVKAAVKPADAPTAEGVESAHARLSKEQAKLVKAAIQLQRHSASKVKAAAEVSLMKAASKLDAEKAAVRHFQQITSKKRALVGKMMKYTDPAKAKGGDALQSRSEVSKKKIAVLAKAIKELDGRLRASHSKTTSAAKSANAAR